MISQAQVWQQHYQGLDLREFCQPRLIPRRGIRSAVEQIPRARPSFPRRSRLINTTSHAKQWEPTGLQAATQTEASGPAVMCQLKSIGWSFSVDWADGATAATPGGALSTWAPLPRPGNDRLRNTGGKDGPLWFCLRCNGLPVDLVSPQADSFVCRHIHKQTSD